MITNYDEQIQFLEMIKHIMSKTRYEVPHLESVSDARSYLNGSATTLKLISELLPPDLYKDVIQYLDTEIKQTNIMIDRLHREGLL